MDDQAQPMTIDELKDKQEIVLFICSSLLSAIGSSAIVFKILQELAQNRSRFMTAYDRMILGLSCFDIIQSIYFAFFSFLEPRETGNTWAFGNPATCQIIGILAQLVVNWAGWYNCLMSYYFLLTILSQVRRKNYVKEYELWMHLSGLFFLVTAIMGYGRGWYGREGGGCWVSEAMLVWIFGGFPRIFTYLSLIINAILIKVILRKSFLQSSEHVASHTLAQKRLTRLMREATSLMFLYIAFYFVTTGLHFIREILAIYFGYHKDDKGKICFLSILNAILLPLQGFFNVFIYIKPAYNRFRATNPTKSMCFVLHQAFFNPKVPQLSYSSYESATAERDFTHSNQFASNAIIEGNVGNPNQALFYSNFQPHSPSSDSSSDAIAEGSVEMPSKSSEDAEENKRLSNSIP